jgi:hypothetical protein
MRRADSYRPVNPDFTLRPARVATFPKDESDRDQIVERLGWTPRQRLDYLLDMLAFEDRARRAHQINLDPLVVPVASLEDVIRSKRAAGREKDLQQLPTLELLLEEIGKRGG